MRALVERIVRRVPVMSQIFDKHKAGIRDIGMKGQNITARTVGLLPDRIAIRQQHGTRIAEPADSSQGPEVVIEGTVFLHEDDDVFHIGKAPGAIVGGNFKRASNAGGERRGKCA